MLFALLNRNTVYGCTTCCNWLFTHRSWFALSPQNDGFYHPDPADVIGAAAERRSQY